MKRFLLFSFLVFSSTQLYAGMMPGNPNKGILAGAVTTVAAAPSVAVATDTFDRTNATTITGSGEGGFTWTGGDSFSITSNQVDPEASAEYYPTYSVTMADADYCASLDVIVGAAGRASPGPQVRNSGGNKYHARFYNSTVELYKNGSGIGTPVAVSVPTTYKTLKLCVSGSATTTLDIYYDGASTPTMTYPDSSSPYTTTGSSGIQCFYCDAAGDVLGDNFKAYDVVGP